MKNLWILFITVLLWGCGTKKNAPPSWISGKPIDPSGIYVYGLGSSFINPNVPYQQAARSNALADLAQEVQSEIYDETKLLQKEDAGGFNSAFQSNTTSTSALRLEDYELVESYADELRYYTLYRLDLESFLRKKALQDAAAMEWINTKIFEAKDANLSASSRLSALVDALDKAHDFQLFGDIQYRTKLNASATEALRSIENVVGAIDLLPVKPAYLGLPATFRAQYKQPKERQEQISLALSSSSGQFMLQEQTIQCIHTGSETRVTLFFAWDWDRIQSAHTETKNWLKNKSQWGASVAVNFEKPTVYIESNGADELVNELEKSLSKDFRIGGRESAQLVLECNGQMASETAGVGQVRDSMVRHKVRIEVQFSLLSTENNSMLWNSTTISGTAISASQETALNSAKSEFIDDFNYLLLPQLLRSLDF